ncbi:MAG: phosphoadenosine phosphosulfate reductase family protein [Bacteroidota bacterium]
MNELNIISVSGGKDSTALYLLAQEFYGRDFLPIFADTDNEHPVTLNYVKNLHHLADGPKVQIVKADFAKHLKRKGIKPSGNSFLDMALWKGRMPSSKAQFCTEHLKLWPIRFYLEKHYPPTKYKWIMHTGIRGAESKKRAARQPYSYNGFFNCLSVLPMLYESDKSMFNLMESRQVPPNPLYALGHKRVGCFPCIHANKTQLALLPDWAWERLAWFEKESGSTWFSPKTVPWKGKGELVYINEVREWCKTSHGGRQYDAFKSAPADIPSCMSGFIECE